MFTLEIRTDNAAFGDDDESRNAEVARILADLAKRLQMGRIGGRLLHVNGNSVGSYGYQDE